MNTNKYIDLIFNNSEKWYYDDFVSFCQVVAIRYKIGKYDFIKQYAISYYAINDNSKSLIDLDYEIHKMYISIYRELKHLRKLNLFIFKEEL
jgi:hypothetical protein